MSATSRGGSPARRGCCRTSIVVPDARSIAENRSDQAKAKQALADTDAESVEAEALGEVVRDGEAGEHRDEPTRRTDP